MEQIHVKLVPTIQFEAPFELADRSGVYLCVEAISVNDEFTRCNIWIDVDHIGTRVYLLSIPAKYHPDFEAQSQAVVDAIAANQSAAQQIRQFVHNFDYVKCRTRQNRQKHILS